MEANSVADYIANQLQSTQGWQNSYSSNSFTFPTTAATTAQTYYASSPFSYSIMRNMIPIYKIIDIKEKERSNNRVIFNIKYDKLFKLPDYIIMGMQGCVYFSSDVYGIYATMKYHYWNNDIDVELNSSDVSKLKKDILFTSANNFESGISNEEVVSFLKNLEIYKEYYHLKLEEVMQQKGCSIEEKIECHKKLNSYLM